jgi:hypothetical protein
MNIFILCLETMSTILKLPYDSESLYTIPFVLYSERKIYRHLKWDLPFQRLALIEKILKCGG